MTDNDQPVHVSIVVQQWLKKLEERCTKHSTAATTAAPLQLEVLNGSPTTPQGDSGRGASAKAS